MLKNLKNRLNESKGFTLVELIVVIAIMVILIALLVPNVIGYISQAQDTANLAAAKSIYNAANTACINYKAKNAGYPKKNGLAALLNGFEKLDANGNGQGSADPTKKLVSVSEGTSAGIAYDETNGSIAYVAVCSGTSLSKGTSNNFVVYNATTGKADESSTAANATWTVKYDGTGTSAKWKS